MGLWGFPHPLWMIGSGPRDISGDSQKYLRKTVLSYLSRGTDCPMTNEGMADTLDLVADEVSSSSEFATLVFSGLTSLADAIVNSVGTRRPSQPS